MGLNENRAPIIVGLTTAVHEEAPVEYESSSIESLRTENKCMITQELKSAVRELVKN